MATDTLASPIIAEQQLGSENIASAAVSAPHAGGEVYSAESIDAARGMCPFLGKLSLDKVNEIFELQALGNQILEQKHQDTSAEQPIEPEPAARTESFLSRLLSERHQESIKADTTATPTQIEKVVPVFYQKAEVAAAIEQLQYQETIKSPKTQQRKIETHKTVENAAPKQLDTKEKVADPVRIIKPKSKVISTPAVTPNNEAEKKPEKPTTKPYIATTALPIREKSLIIPAAITEEQPPEVELPFTAPYKTVEATVEPSSYPEPKVNETFIAPIFQTTESSQTEQYDEEISAEEPFELPSTLAVVQETLQLVTDSLIKPEHEQSENIQKIITEISAVPIFLEATKSVENVQSEEKLEQLFIELFETLEVDFDEVLVHSFIELIKSHSMHAKNVDQIRDIATEFTLPKEDGTKEFWQQLHQKFSNVKRAVLFHLEIGRSAIRLYIN